jgi:hypothetical protein
VQNHVERHGPPPTRRTCDDAPRCRRVVSAGLTPGRSAKLQFAPNVKHARRAPVVGNGAATVAGAGLATPYAKARDRRRGSAGVLSSAHAGFAVGISGPFTHLAASSTSVERFRGPAVDRPHGSAGRWEEGGANVDPERLQRRTSLPSDIPAGRSPVPRRGFHGSRRHRTWGLPAAHCRPPTHTCGRSRRTPAVPRKQESRTPDTGIGRSCAVPPLRPTGM